MSKIERDFKGVWIPCEIWLDERLNALDKIILAEIDSLDQGDGGCWASNQYLAEFCQCSVTKVSTSISLLVKLGYIKVCSFDGRNRTLKSCIKIGVDNAENGEADLQKSKGSLTKIERQTYKKRKADLQILKANNIESNTKINTKKNVFVAPDVETVKTYCEERGNTIDAGYFVDYYAARGWELTKGRKMVDWKAAVRTWERNGYSKPRTGPNGVELKEEYDHSIDDLL